MTTAALDVAAYLDRHQKKDLLRLLTCGSVDDGKSTLIGRLLHDSSAVYDDQLASLERDSRKLGNAGIDASGTRQIDFSLLVDGLKAEREQGITIDVAYRYFTTPRRKFIIADTPGHEQYTRNMATGASTCDLAVVLIDARHGVVTQTRRHAFIVSLLGIRHVVVAVNKMDLVGWDQQVFQSIRDAFSEYAAKLEFTDVHFIPMSALTGDGVVANGAAMPWFKGAPLLEHLETVHIASDRNLIDLRLPVQLVIRPDLSFRGFAGTVASGVVRRGDAVMALPSRRTSRVRSISTHDGELDEAHPPLAVTVTLEDEIDVSRGDVLVHPGNLPSVGHDLDAMLVWMSETPLSTVAPGAGAGGRDGQYLVKLGTAVSPAMVTSIRYRIDVDTSHRSDADRLALNEIGRVVISATRPLVFDTYAKNRGMGSLILIDRLTNATVAAGMVRGSAAAGAGASGKLATQAQAGQVDERARQRLLGQTPVTVWLTGLSKSNKTPIALALERRLIESGHAANVLDGARLRRGINRDLGFSGDDRAENLRRAADIARLCNDAGLITICAFVSPYAADRAAARATIGPARFIEVWCAAPLAWCEAHDDEGAFAKARRGELPFFSGVNAPYEEPERAELVLPTHELAIGEAVERIWELLRKRGALQSPG